MISEILNFLNHPFGVVKWAKVSSTVIEKSAEGTPVQSNEPKTICIITTYPHFGLIYSEMGKENKLTFRNYITYWISLIYLPQKEMKIYKNYLQNYLQK